MALDTAPLLAALEPPAFRHEGQTYRGRHLSVLEWAGHMERLTALGEGKLGLMGQQGFYRDLCNAWFPDPAPRPWWKVWAPKAVTVGDLVLTLPRAVQEQVLASFIHSQLHAMGMVPAAGSTTTAPTTT